MSMWPVEGADGKVEDPGKGFLLGGGAMVFRDGRSDILTVGLRVIHVSTVFLFRSLMQPL